MRIIFKTIIFVLLPMFAVSQTLDEHEHEDSTSSNPSGIIRHRVNKDSVKPDVTLFAWKYINGWNKISAEIDTSQINATLNDPVKNNGLYNIGLGNLGQPVMLTDFNQRNKLQYIHWAFKHYKPYLKTHEDIRYFNTKSPYTRLYYTSGSSRLNTFHFIHSQNVNRDITFGLDCNFFSSEGFMINQLSRDRNGSFWFNIDNNQYRNKTSINFNRIDVQNNGGVTNTSYVTDSSLSMRDINTKLSGTTNQLKYIDGGFDHELTVLKTKNETIRFETGIGHEFYFLLAQRKYNDPASTLYTDLITGEEKDYFQNRYNSQQSQDTISKRQISNSGGIYFKLGNINFIKAAFYGKYSAERYTNIFRDLMFEYPNDTTIKTFSHFMRIDGAIFNNRLTFSAGLDISPYKGYRYEEQKTYSNIQYNHKIIKDSASLIFGYSTYKTAPDYHLTKYSSNHYKWKQALPMQLNTDIALRWSLHKTQLEVIVQYNKIDNYLYLDVNRNWQTSPQSIEVLGAGLQKTLNIGKYFSIRVKGLYQYSADTVIDIPNLATSATLLYHTPLHFKSTGGLAYMHVGIDGWINSTYYMPNFDPALNSFFMQRDEKLGNYPYFDFFISFHVKRLVGFIRLEHINAGINGVSYFDAYSYPSRRLDFKFGVSWTFYD